MSTSSSIGARCSRSTGRPYSARSRSRILRRRRRSGRIRQRLWAAKKAARGDRASAAAEVAGMDVSWRQAGDAACALPARRADGLLAVEDFLERSGRAGARPAGLRPLGQAGRLRLLDRGLRPLPRGLRWRSVGIERFSLVVHDWGAVGLALRAAQARTRRAPRGPHLVPLTGGYRWHRIARGWRTPLVGELMMGFTSAGLSALAAARDRRPLVGDLRPRHPAGHPQALPLGPRGDAREGRPGPRPA